MITTTAAAAWVRRGDGVGRRREGGGVYIYFFFSFSYPAHPVDGPGTSRYARNENILLKSTLRAGDHNDAIY